MKYLLLVFIFFWVSVRDGFCQIVNSEINTETLKAEEYVEKMMYFYEINRDSCMFYTKMAAKEYQRLNHWEKVPNLINNIAVLLFDKGEYKEFQIYQDSSYKIAKTYLDKTDVVFLNTLSLACAAKVIKGDYNKAIKIGLEAKNFEGEIFDMKSAACDQLSNVYTMVGEYEKAIQTSMYSLSLRKDTLGENRWTLATSYNPLAYAYLKSGKFKKAAINYNKAAFYNRLNFDDNISRNEYYSCLIKLVEVYTNDQRWKEANKLITELNEVIDDLKGIRLADYKSVLAYYMIANKDSDDAYIINLLIEANKLYYIHLTNSVSDEKIARNLNYLSEVYADSGDFDKAKEVCLVALDSIGTTKFIDQPEKIINKVWTLKILNNLLSYSIQTEDKIETECFANNLKDISRVLILDNTSAETKLYWAEENLKIFSKTITGLIQQGNLELAYTLAEENKSNILINDLSHNDAHGVANVNENLIEKEKSLRAEINYFRNQINLNQKDNNGELAELKLQAEQDLDALIDEIELSNPEFYKLKYNSTDISISDVQELLNKNSALVEYFISDTQCFAFCITPHSRGLVELEDYSILKPKIDSFYSLISNKSMSSKDIDTISKELYQSLFSDIEENFNNSIENLVIVPDAVLSNLPFELIKGESDDYIGFKYNVSYQYSAKLWKLIKERHHDSKSTDFIGYAFDNGNKSFNSERSCYNAKVSNLKCSKEEITNITSILSDKIVNTSLNNISDIFSKAADSRILHLATHACADPINPDLSTLFFNDSSISNSEIQLKEIKAELVVLSACESGYGKVYKGEGAMSLSKSFFYAGCNSTLVSLWPVDDCTTADLMKYFYENLNQGQAKDEALRNAKRHYLETTHPNTIKPYYWAGFVLIGDTSPVWPGKFPYAYFILVFLILAILLFYLKKRSATT